MHPILRQFYFGDSEGNCLVRYDNESGKGDHKHIGENVELILIHPFCEGNGRTARLLADLMATQANMPPLNYLAIDQVENPEGFERYIGAIHAGFNKGDYSLIQDIFTILLRQSV